MKIIYNELDYEDVLEGEDTFHHLFDDPDQDKQYVVQGTLGLWDGKHYVYSNRVHSNLKDTIYSLGGGYIKVYEEKYGRLYVDICHHDGVNVFEIKELSSLGQRLLENGYNKNIFNRKGATRNVNFIKSSGGDINENHLQ